MKAILPEKLDYAAHWTLNAESFTKQSCYAWMAGLLKSASPKRILDIGCGAGHGLLALAEAFAPTIVAVDENAACLSEAQQRLEENGYGAEVIFRIGYEPTPGGAHLMHMEQSPIRSEKRISLIHGDMLLNDPALLAHLQQCAPFDAVTVWLIGTDPDRFRKCQNLSSLRIQSPSEYRLHVQNQIYILADKMLRPGGCLQIVDRGEVPNNELLRDDWLAGHRHQASPTSLMVEDLQYRTYTEPDAGVGMVDSPGTSGRRPKLDALAMISVISRKS